MNADGIREKLFALVGAPYGDPRFEPADCWGFVRHAYSLAGVELPKNIWRARHSYREVHGGKVEPLDVIYFRSIMLEQRHVGIAIDQLYILQSSKMTNGVAAIRLGRAGIKESIQGIYRLKGIWCATPERCPECRMIYCECDEYGEGDSQ